jgi:hypothetical protein
VKGLFRPLALVAHCALLCACSIYDQSLLSSEAGATRSGSAGVAGNAGTGTAMGGSSPSAGKPGVVGGSSGASGGIGGNAAAGSLDGGRAGNAAEGGAGGGAGDGDGDGYYGSDTLLGYYRFDSASGEEASDSSGHDRHGSLGANGLEPLPAWATGKLAGALELSGGNFVRLPYTADYNGINTNNACTLAAWTWRTSNKSSWSMIISRQYKSTAREHFGLAFNDGRAAALIDTAKDPNRFCTAGVASPLDTWVHIAATYDGTTLRTYENGSEVCSYAAAGPMENDDTMSDVIVGGNVNSADEGVGETFVGLIDELVIYNRVLTPPELVELAAASPPPTE